MGKVIQFGTRNCLPSMYAATISVAQTSLTCQFSMENQWSNVRSAVQSMSNQPFYEDPLPLGSGVTSLSLKRVEGGDIGHRITGIAKLCIAKPASREPGPSPVSTRC